MTTSALPKPTAHTIYEAFASGIALVRTRFWYYASLGAAILIGLFVEMAINSLAMRTGFTVLTGLVICVTQLVSGMLTIGLYRSIWDGLSGRPVQFKSLFWAFAGPIRWQLPALIAPLSALSMLMLSVMHGHPHQPLWVTLLIVSIPIAASLVVNYAYAITARTEIGPLESLKKALGIFRKGSRRWLALPFLIWLAEIGAAIPLSMLLAVLYVLKTHLHPAQIVVEFLMIAIVAPLVVGAFIAGIIWAAGVLVAAAGSLAGNAS